MDPVTAIFINTKAEKIFSDKICANDKQIVQQGENFYLALD
jgi:hypothetical protein